MTFVAWSRSVSFHVVFKDILGTEAEVFLSTKGKYNLAISTHIMVPIKSRDKLSMTSFAYSERTRPIENLKAMSTFWCHQLENLRTEKVMNIHKKRITA